MLSPVHALFKCHHFWIHFKGQMLIKWRRSLLGVGNGVILGKILIFHNSVALFKEIFSWSSPFREIDGVKKVKNRWFCGSRIWQNNYYGQLAFFVQSTPISVNLGIILKSTNNHKVKQNSLLRKENNNRMSCWREN